MINIQLNKSLNENNLAFNIEDNKNKLKARQKIIQYGIIYLSVY